MRQNVICALAAAGAINAGALAEVTELPLNYNFNGMVHAGENGDPDNPDGFRSISDRALDLRAGIPPTLRVSADPGSSLTYNVVDTALVLDMVHLGDRNTVSGGFWAYDDNDGPDGDNVGVSPNWQPQGTSDQSDPQTSTFTGITLGADAQIGVLYQASNFGGDFDVTLGFSDGATITVTLNAPDWFQAQDPAAPAPGNAFQASKGIFAATDGTDLANTGAADLNVVEAVIKGGSLLGDLAFDLDGRTLNSITFGNPSNSDAGYGILAASVDDGFAVIACDTDLDMDGDSDIGDLLEYLSFWFATCP